MTADSGIEWTGLTWNPLSGCDKISPGCDLCYALRMAARLKAIGSPRYQQDGNPATSGPGFGVTLHRDLIDLPRKWRKPRMVFVNSMSDLFHAAVSVSFVAAVFRTMAATPQHTYQILTKRASRLPSVLGRVHSLLVEDGTIDNLKGVDWPLQNVWLGVSVEDRARESRIRHLTQAPAAVRFVSAEPLLEPITILPGMVDWIIVGGESGPGARPMDLEWVRGILRAHEGRTPVFVKQLGAHLARDIAVGGRTISAHGDRAGTNPKFWPDDLRVRQYPTTERQPA